MILNPCPTTLGIAMACAAVPAIAEESHRPFTATPHRDALLAGAQAIAVDRTSLAAAARTPACRLESVPLGQLRTADLDLQLVDVYAPDAIKVVEDEDGGRSIARPAARIWTGSVADEPDSEVFLSHSRAGTFGWVTSRGERFILTTGDPKGDRRLVSYPSTGVANALIDWAPFKCSTADVVGPPPDREEPAASLGGPAGDGPCMTVDIAIDTDEDFLEHFGGDEEAALGYIETLVAGANIIFQRDCNTQLSLVFARLWSTTDPWDSFPELGALRNHWQEEMSHIDRDTTHLLTPFPIGGGFAMAIGSVCSNDTSYAVSGHLNGFFPTPLEPNSPQNWDIIVFTHELGHLFDSPHTHNYWPWIDECGVGSCETASEGTIMSYCHLCPGGLANMELTFHPRVRERIVSYLASRPCVADVECSRKVGDLDGDGDVDGEDMGLLMASWGTSNPDHDLDGDGTIGGGDLGLLLMEWGSCC